MISFFALLFCQILFIYARTLNVKMIAKGNKVGAILTGFVVGIFWLVTTAIGVDSMLKADYLTVAGHLIGGAIGTYWGMYSKNKDNQQSNKQP
jgi:hypothetical protein